MSSRRVPRRLKAILHARAVARRNLKQRQRAKHRSGYQPSARALPKQPRKPPREDRQFGPQPYSLPESEIVVPEELDFDSLAIPTLHFFRRLRAEICQRRRMAILVDHSRLKRLTPEAALVLVAEMYRSCELFRDCRKFARLPDAPAIRDLLGEVGYYDYFRKGKELWTKPPKPAVDFLSHQKGTKLEPTVVKRLMQHFASVSTLDQEMSTALYEALIECMNNVLEHAYPSNHPQANRYRLWWILSYIDASNGKISFCFFDQGTGIPRTIRTRFRDAPWLGPLGPSDSELLQTAVIQGGYSSTKKRSKGRGLPTLKRFTDSASDGELSIVTHKSICTFHTGRPPVRSDEKISLPGTLIAWNIRRA